MQRVGYRRFVLDVAQEMGLAGYAKNERDGSVTILVQGADAGVKEFVSKARNPTPPAMVRGIREEAVKSKKGLGAFMIKFGSVQEELQEGFGAIETEFYDYRNEFRGFTGEFRDYRKEFRDYRKEFRGFATRTDENFGVLDTKYGEISAKLTSILEALEKESVESRKELTRAVDNLSKLVERYTK